MSEHLFNSRGQFIAFRRNQCDRYVFTKDGNWLGWLSYGDFDVHHSSSGKYLATIVEDRLLVLANRPHRGRPGLPGLPGMPGLPGLPGVRSPLVLPAGASDLLESVMSEFQYLFDAAGNWIAFRIRNYLWDSESNWLGWLPFDDEKVFSPDGSYIGSILRSDRLARPTQSPHYGRVGRPGRPGRPSRPGRPGRPGRMSLPAGWQDLSAG